MRSYISFLATVLASQCMALDIPSNIQSFYDSVKSAGSCSNKLSGEFSAGDGPSTFTYCGDHLDDYKVIYLQGTGGALADMDIDCDGTQGGKGDDGRCGASTDTQGQTSFQDTVASYKKGVTNLNAFVHPYVVFGNVGNKGDFKPQSQGVEPLSLMAVVCGGKMFYGIWGDENGDDGPKAVIGEASISMATLCYGDSMTGGVGHGETDVLYIAFTGQDAVPGASAAWNAGSTAEFQSSIQSLGNKLIQRIGGGSGGGDNPPSSTPNSSLPATTLKTLTKSGGSATYHAVTVPTSSSSAVSPNPGTCSWSGHCAGAQCSNYNDCSDDMVCKRGKCAEP